MQESTIVGMRRSVLAIISVCLIGLVLFPVLGEVGLFNTETWTRESPLTSPTAVSSVQDGQLTLADGRTFRPAGMRRPDGISTADYDHALRIATAQGVNVVRDLGDGRAFMLAEPKMYNWCGTRGYGGNPYGHWAGGYFRCPLSEFLIQSGWARAQADEPGLTDRERWRIDGAASAFGLREKPLSLSESAHAFRFDTPAAMMKDYDAFLQATWKPSPAP
jgi:hypothetical protein